MSAPNLSDSLTFREREVADRYSRSYPGKNPRGGPDISIEEYNTYHGINQPLPPYDYEVKSWPQFFEPMVSGKKLHDMRNKLDRAYRVGDRMLLREFDPFGGGYTGRCAIAMITYITSNETPCALSSVGLGDDMAILSVVVSGPYPDDDRNA